MVGSFASIETEPKVNAVAWPSYPPCVSGFCTNQICCAQGNKFRWPNLVGKKEKDAKAVIQMDNPLVTIVVLPPGKVGSNDLCCNRLYLIIDSNDNVSYVPTVG
ncbi:hypothetical protein FH972_010162 [Carpinus fangiana]|uniref:Proteinase inhibitor I13 n=1 Tax=Carpinus fangiana TaxID=176857 RepID=A0A660KP29_9ROSI|nr:hypothetical protein FH972_010162 [Carpinus fangiana]